VPVGVRPKSVGISRTGAAGTGSRRNRAATSVHSACSGESAANGAHGSSGSVPTFAASSANVSLVSRDEWFCGWPSVASP
jgi:hypothetical protein